MNSLLHVILLRDGRALLSKKRYASWRDIQDEYADYMASLGPWSIEDVFDFCEIEKWTYDRETVLNFLSSPEQVLDL